ncbi:DNA topoisomerase VI [Candidatus Woesearchaeota archaeon]|nr:DNA topoisomerase VI [Candidatus Woesearchaeota archaeon]
MDTKKKIEELAKNIIEQLVQQQNPSMTVPIRSLSNVYFDKKSQTLQIHENASTRSFYNVNHVRKFVQTLAVAAGSKKLVERDITVSIRDLYYNIKRTLPNTKIDLLDSQTESDKAIEDLEAITGLPRERLGLIADASGTVSGKVVIEDSGDTIDWSKLGSGGWAIPSDVENITFKSVKAKYVIYMEKQAVWHRLHQDRYWDKHNCIIMASKGQAPRGVRRLLIRLSEEFKLPIYVLTDFDPWGFYIYSVLKYGSINLATQSDTLAVTGAQFLGITADDIEHYGLKKHFIKFKDVDMQRIGQLENYDWFKASKAWQRQFKLMRSYKAKAEIQSLSNRDIQFITNTYLPEKIKKQQFVE